MPIYHFKEPKEAYEITRKFTKEGVSAGAVEFPPYVTFELLNVCNFRCIMCPGSYIKRNRQEMDFDLFKKIIDEIFQYGSLIRFIGYDEPLLYSKIKEAIKYIKGKGLLLHITTNGSLLNKELIKNIIDNKVDSIIFSFQGLTKKEYCLMRNSKPEIYSRVIRNIRLLHRTRKENKPFMKITTTITSRDLPADKEKFAKGHLKYVDEVQISGFTHFLPLDNSFGRKKIWNELKITKPEKIGGVKCFTPNYELLIKSDGSVHLCCGAYGNDLEAGNVKENSLFNVWHSKKANDIRKLLNNGKLDKFKTCSVCAIRYKYDNMNSTIVNTRKGEAEKFIK